MYMLYCGPIFSSINPLFQKYTEARIYVHVNYNLFCGDLDGNEYIVDVLVQITN